MVGRGGLWHGTDAHARASGTEGQNCCDCLWRIHHKFKQTAAYKVRIKSSGKICNCLSDLKEFKNFISKWKNLWFSIWTYGVSLHRSGSSNVLRRGQTGAMWVQDNTSKWEAAAPLRTHTVEVHTGCLAQAVLHDWYVLLVQKLS